jgi:hypothetical protein
VCVSTWFVAICAPLWLDETVSLFLIEGGFAGITSRQVWFAVILPALLICFLALKIGKGKSFWRQIGVALVAARPPHSTTTLRKLLSLVDHLRSCRDARPVHLRHHAKLEASRGKPSARGGSRVYGAEIDLTPTAGLPSINALQCRGSERQWHGSRRPPSFGDRFVGCHGSRLV